MIDTIILRVHNVMKYETLIKRLELDSMKNGGFTTETAKVDADEVKRLRGMGYKKPKEIIEILRMNKSGDFLVKTQVGKQMNASNHYAFTYFINWTKDHIEFNFSVPKYKYGSNVLMFVEHYVDRDYNYPQCSTLEHNIRRAPDFIMQFIRYFLRKEFPLDKIDFSDVEVNRIDVCFNQMFRTRDEALKYLEYQKRLKKKYAKEEEGVMREYATSLMYTTKRYSAKIYHKGSEYRNNDYKEHLKINKEKGRDYFRTEKFQMFADRMLRYELTMRNTQMNYLHKHNIFRKECPFFQADYKCYLRVMNVKQKNDRIAKKIGSLPDAEKDEYAKNHPYEKISGDDKKVFKYISNILESRTFFMLEVDEETKMYNKKSVPYVCKKAKFGTLIIKLCLEKLLSFMEEFKITELKDEQHVKAAIERVNNIGRNTLPTAEMMKFYDLLQRYGSFKEAAKYAGISRATFYRYKSRFKRIGVSETSLKPVDNYAIPEHNHNLKEYHSTMLSQDTLLRGIKIC